MSPSCIRLSDGPNTFILGGLARPEGIEDRLSLTGGDTFLTFRNYDMSAVPIRQEAICYVALFRYLPFRLGLGDEVGTELEAGSGPSRGGVESSLETAGAAAGVDSSPTSARASAPSSEAG